MARREQPPLVIERMTATATPWSTPVGMRWRLAGLGAAMGAAAAAILWAVGPGATALIVAMPAVCIIAMALSPDRRIVIDAGAREIRVLRRFPGNVEECVKVVPFSAVRSIGVDRRAALSDGGPADYAAVTRIMNRWRPITLYYFAVDRSNFRSDEEAAWHMRTDPWLQSLRELTGLRREDRV